MKTTSIIRAIASLFFVAFAYQAHAAAVVPLSSGIKAQEYKVEWCAAQGSRVGVSGCLEGTLTVGPNGASILYNGQNFPAGGVAANNTGLPGTTRTANGLAAAGANLISLFSSSTDGKMSLEGEGVVTVKATLTDHADNISFIWVRYKIDKTGPQIAITGMTEGSDYTHYEGTVTTSGAVFKNDSAANNSTGLKYTDPAISSYAGRHTALLQNTGHTRSPLHTIYFQNTTTGAGSDSPFTVNVDMSDTFNGYLTASAAGVAEGSYSGGPLISDVSELELRDAAGGFIRTVPLTGLLSTAYLSSNADENSQSNYRLRLFDRSVNASGAPKSGNYSEAAFYAVRDNTSPNMGGNGNEASLAAAYERLLQFPDSATVYDTGAYVNSFTPISGGVSRMFGATDSLALGYRLNDTGITGNGVGGSAAYGSSTALNDDTFKLYNAGINTTATELLIEDTNTPASQLTFVTYANRYVNSGTSTKNFSKVDNDLVSNKTYRKYGTSFKTASFNTLCDLVGNCLTPKLEFRVAAAALDSDKSDIQVTLDSKGGDGKILADGKDNYKFTYKLRDIYDNKVVPVVAAENNDAQFKTVRSTVTVHNGLNVDQLTSVPKGVKLAIATDLEIDNAGVVDVSNINTPGSTATIVATENPTAAAGPNGNYSYSFASGVPSKGLYPYISDTSRLQVESLTNVATASAPASATYPSTGDRIGTFGPKIDTSGTTNDLVTGNVGGLKEIAGSKNISVDITNYGKITTNPSNGTIAFANLPTYRVNFEYASPYLYGMYGRQVLVDGKFIKHSKKLFVTRGDTHEKIISTVSAVPYNVYEKDIVAYNPEANGKDEQPGILNFTLRSEGNPATETLVNTGARYQSSPNMAFTGTTQTGAYSFMNSPVTKIINLDSYSLTGSGYNAEMMMASIAGKKYDNSRLRVGVVTALGYQVNSQVIQLPSVARGLINPTTSAEIGQYDMSRSYFDGNYAMGICTDAECVNPTTNQLQDIAITGLTNQYNAITTDTGSVQANTVIEAEISRSTFVTTVKKNVATLTAGFGGTNPKKWCSIANINQSILDGTDSTIANCTIESNGEKITFIDGNTTLYCGSECKVSTKRTIVVRNGSLYLKSDITTLDGTTGQTAGQLLLVSMATDGISDITIDTSGAKIDRTASNVKGWMFIDTNITNIDAFLVSQGPITSFEENPSGSNQSKIFGGGGNIDTADTELVNQLHIYGSMLALNTIGGGREGNISCPYVVTNCTPETAQYFDLIYMRRFKTIGLSYFTNDSNDNNELVPYYPDKASPDSVKRSGGFTGADPDGTALTLNVLKPLRHITDPAYQNYPMLIERDTRWNNSPSRLFLAGN